MLKCLHQRCFMILLILPNVYSRQSGFSYWPTCNPPSRGHSRGCTGHSFMLQGNKIDCEDEVKLLGVTFDFKLTFNSHVSHICKKASQQLNVLKRIGNNLSKLGKLTIYYSFILSNFNYCPLVWHFCGEGNTKKLEKIQERALRFIYNDSDSSYENLLEKSQLPSLRLRRLRSMAIEVFKIINKQTPVYLHDLVTIKKSSYSFRYNNTVNIPRVNTTRYGLHSLRWCSKIVERTSK